jgi:hypothetical protein
MAETVIRKVWKRKGGANAKENDCQLMVTIPKGMNITAGDYVQITKVSMADVKTAQ